jgi:hypothetical protein
MLLPVIDPRTRASFRVAIVEQVLDSFHFVVSLLEEPQVRDLNLCTRLTVIDPRTGTRSSFRAVIVAQSWTTYTSPSSVVDP